MKRLLFIVVMLVIVCGVFAIPLSGVGKHRQYNKALVQAQNQLKEKVIQRAGRYGYILHNPYGKTYPIDAVVEKALADAVETHYQEGGMHVVTLTIDPDKKAAILVKKANKYIEVEKSKFYRTDIKHQANLIYGVYYKAYGILNDGYTEYLSKTTKSNMEAILQYVREHTICFKIESHNDKYVYYMGMGDQYKLDGFIYYDPIDKTLRTPRVNELYGQFNREPPVTDPYEAYAWETYIKDIPLAYEELDANGRNRIIDVPHAWYCPIRIANYMGPVINLNGLEDAEVRIIIE